MLALERILIKGSGICSVIGTMIFILTLDPSAQVAGQVTNQTIEGVIDAKDIPTGTILFVPEKNISIVVISRSKISSRSRVSIALNSEDTSSLVRASRIEVPTPWKSFSR